MDFTQKRLTFAPLLAVALISVPLLLQPAAAEAKPCGSVTLASGHSWVVGGAGISCGFMRKWTRSMLQGNGKPPGWTCHKRGRGYDRSGACSKEPRGTPFFVYYPPD